MYAFFRTRDIATVAIALSLQLTATSAWSQTAAGAAGESAAEGSPVMDYLRKTISFSGEFRSRWEGGVGKDFAATPRDSYVLTRTRLGFGFAPTSWLRFFAQAQDARAMFYKVTPSTTVADPFDWRQGWVEIGMAEGNGVRRVGRQDMVVGSGRLISSGDWSNVTKTFNVARGAITQSGFKMDLFAGTVVQCDSTRMDRGKPGEHFYGSYVTLNKILPGASFEPFAFMKTALNVKSKDGKTGDTDTFYVGGRLIGKAPGAIDYSVEAVKEAGMYADDAIDAFGFIGGGGWTVPAAPWSIHLTSDYTFASGDSGVADGHHQNFDYLYGPQTVNSLTGQFGWKNIKDWSAGGDFKPLKKLTVKLLFRDYWLANVKDSLYNSSGAKTVTNAKATSAHVGEGVDAQFAYSFDAKTSVGVGVGNLAPGSYLAQSKKTTGFIYPYLYVLRRM